MSRYEQKGIAFGFTILFIWLLGLTSLFIYDKMNTGEKINKVIILPPPVESLDIADGLE